MHLETDVFPPEDVIEQLLFTRKKCVGALYNILWDVDRQLMVRKLETEGEELRVDGKKKDDLQEAISAIKAINIGLPIDFVNFRD